MFIKVGRSFAFLLLASETAPRAASVQDFFASSGHGEESMVFFGKSWISFKVRFQGSPPTTEPNQGDTLRGSPALCQGYPGAILAAEGMGLLLGLNQALFREK
ncbi:hypothetical protein PoB_006782000 [Plakobranchus ocellatus]|uniref:Uncharacterized protein n=1 Tax=Plakobranchus ocellatus TaxID=259542 RepID=A0AAV4DBB0_9GAST|nr:hypothetical protein PoB_006782000 [Plakobranchus ocellatus]